MEMQEEAEVRKEAMERAAQVVMSVAPTEEDIRRHENLHLRSFADAACQTVPVSINLPGEDSGTGGEDGDHPHSVKALKKRAQMLERLNMGGGGTTGILAVPRIAAFFSQPPAFVSLLLGPSGKAAVAMGTVEPMGRGELEGLIAELYTAKISADRIDDRCQYPRETFDTFVIGHLTKSLGLKSLAVAKIYQLVVTLKSFLPQPRKKIRRGKSTKSARKGAAAAALLLLLVIVVIEVAIEVAIEVSIEGLVAASFGCLSWWAGGWACGGYHRSARGGGRRFGRQRGARKPSTTVCDCAGAVCGLTVCSIQYLL